MEAVVTCTFILSMPIGSQYKKSEERTEMNEKIFSFDGPTRADYSKAITAKIAGVITDFCFFIVSPEMLYGIKQYI